MSGRLRDALYDFGLEDSFRRANFRLQLHYGFSLSAERIRKATLKQAQTERTGQRERKPVSSLPSKGAAAVVSQCAGSMVRIVHTAENGDARKKRDLDWKEARICVARASGTDSSYYEGLIGDVHEVGHAWAHATLRAGWASHTLIHCMGDGASWIAQQAALQFPGSSFLLDLYHVCEYLAEASEVCALKESPQRWQKRQRTKLLKGKASQVIAELEEKSEGAEVPDEHSPVRLAYRYLNNRKEQLDYPKALENNLPVGTGMIESAHKQIIQQRLKGPGMAWLTTNADALISARAHRATYIESQEWLKEAA